MLSSQSWAEQVMTEDKPILLNKAVLANLLKKIHLSNLNTLRIKHFILCKTLCDSSQIMVADNWKW